MPRKLYRVVVRRTASLQPGSGTYWRTTVEYCGLDLDEARIAYHANVPLDTASRSFGSRVRETQFEVIPEHEPVFDSVTDVDEE